MHLCVVRCFEASGESVQSENVFDLMIMQTLPISTQRSTMLFFSTYHSTTCTPNVRNEVDLSNLHKQNYDVIRPP
jgi:hypothetical protein